MHNTVAAQSTVQPEDLDFKALDALFSPGSIAILGASGRESNPFARPLKYIVEYGFEGEIYPINPGYESLQGITCYSSVESVPGNIDLALALIPASGIEAELEALAAKGTRTLVVFASGFGEAGADGLARQSSLVETARGLGIRLIGPNCQGVLSVPSNTYGTFTAALDDGEVRAGGLSWVGQSGAVGGSILSLARASGIGIAHWVSTGNQADLDSIEIGSYLIEREETTVLSMYLESSVDEQSFRSLAQRAQNLGKSLILLRSATSPVGARAAISHTGAIIGDDAAFQVVVRDYGVIEVKDIDELVRVAHAHTVLPKTSGKAVAIVTTSGGAGSIAADALYDEGLNVIELSDVSQNALREYVPAFGATDNPIDVTAQIFRESDVSDFIKVCQMSLDFDEIDATMIVLTLVTGDLAVQMAHAISDMSMSKPLALVWSAAREQTAEARNILRKQGIPVFDSTRQAAATLATLYVDQEGNNKHEPEYTYPVGYDSVRVQEFLQSVGSGTLNEGNGRELLVAAGIQQPAAQLLTHPEKLSQVIDSITGPYVVKIQAGHILHKTELGGVVVGVAEEHLEATVNNMFVSFSEENIEGVLVSELAPPGIELIFGVTKAAISGLPMVTVGLGGTATEIYRDTITKFAPVSASQAKHMLNQLVAAPLLHGYRGSEPVNMDELASAIERLSWLAMDAGQALAEFEINPLRVTTNETVALDFLMILDPKEGS